MAGGFTSLVFPSVHLLTGVPGLSRWVGIVEQNIAFAGKDGRSNGSPTFTCIKKNFMMLRDAGLTKVFREPKRTIRTRLNVLENQKKVLTKMKKRKRLR